jgi:hypothetical protein
MNRFVLIEGKADGARMPPKEVESLYFVTVSLYEEKRLGCKSFRQMIFQNNEKEIQCSTLRQ